ncbi:MAG: hypothetical protein E6I37_07220 [Chloroflexi bacterium]|nr:MAG: hypothetical protein E6I37_07220 [Chloroflexota bacterium]
MRRLVLIGSAIAALAWGSVAAYASTATVTTASPWAYACGHTTFGNPATKEDTPDTNGCPANDVPGTATAGLGAGTLSLSKLCGDADSAKCTADDLASGATVKGLTTLTAASWDLVPESYCGAGAPRLNVVTSDGKTHFFGCAANRSGNHVDFKLDAAGDGSGNGGIVGKTVTSIDIVQDETGTANLIHLSFTGTAAVTATPTPSPTAAPTTPTLATTGGGMPIWPMIGLLLAALGLAGLTIRRRTA